MFRGIKIASFLSNPKSYSYIEFNPIRIQKVRKMISYHLIFRSKYLFKFLCLAHSHSGMYTFSVGLHGFTGKIVLKPNICFANSYL